MKQIVFKITSIFIVLCILFSFSSCKDKEEENTTDVFEAKNTEITEEDTSETNDTDESKTSTDTNDETTTQEASPIVKKPETKEEIVQYYVDAVNKVKTSAKSIAKVYTNTINYQNIVEVGNNSTISNIAQGLMGTFLKEDKTKTEFSSVADFVAYFPPKQSQTCNLKADMVDIAECNDLGNEFEIKIKMNSSMSNPDVNPPMGGSKIGTTFNIVDNKEITDAAGSMVKLEGVKNSYFDASLVCRIDKETGNMTRLEQVLPSTMEFSKVTAAVVITVNNPKIGLEYHEHWEINW